MLVIILGFYGVVYKISAEIRFWQNEKFCLPPLSTVVIRPIFGGKMWREKYRRKFLVKYRLLDTAEYATAFQLSDWLYSLFVWHGINGVTKQKRKYKTVKSNQNFCRKLSVSQSIICKLKSITLSFFSIKNKISSQSTYIWINVINKKYIIFFHNN